MTIRKSENFKLEKLYLDCIDENGNCFIIYHAKLRYFFINITYTELIFSDYENVTSGNALTAETGSPLINDDLCFCNSRLRISGIWKRTDKPLSVFSYNDPQDHQLTWDCHHPKTNTEIVYNYKTYKGLGYAESLFLNIKPNRLPIEELRWGRFLSEKATLVWIDWEGSFPVKKIFFNSVEYNDAVFQEDSIIFGGGSFIIRFREITVIRKGKLENIFHNMPWLRLFFNKRILGTYEVKYKAKSILYNNSVVAGNGWSLFEIVTWKN